MKTFLALFQRFYVQGYEEYDSLNSAVGFLKSGSDRGDFMPIAVIEKETGKMAWFEEYLGEEECHAQVDILLKRNGSLTMGCDSAPLIRNFKNNHGNHKSKNH